MSEASPPDDVATTGGVVGVRLGCEDLVEGAQNHFRAALRRPRSAVIAVLIAAMGFASGALLVPVQAPDFLIGTWVAFAAVAYFCGLITLIYLVSVPRGVRRAWQQDEGLHEPLDISWHDGGYRVKGHTVAADKPWSSYCGWRESKNLFQLYYSPSNYQILPKRHLDERRAQNLRKALRAAGIPPWT